MAQTYTDIVDVESFRLAVISLDTHPHTKATVPSVTLTTYRFSNSSEITYNALSYTWGSAHPSNAEAESDTSILLNGKTVEVQPNLYGALVELQAACSDTPIWIDALCINQADPNERSSQVSVMNQIYGKANRVIVWLGKPFPELEAGIKAAERIGTESVPHTLRMIGGQTWDFSSDLSTMPQKYGMDPIDAEEALGLVTLFMSNWFARIWVIQEVSLTNDVVILCNGKFAPFDCVGYTAAFLHYSGFFQPVLNLVPKDRPGIYLRGNINFYQSERIQLLREWCRGEKSLWTGVLKTIDFEAGLNGTHAKSSELILLRFLVTAFGFQATDPRDTIYGLGGILKHMAAEDGLVVPLEFEPNYGIDITDLLRDVACKIIQATDSLVYVTLVKDPTVRETPGLPSWVPNFPPVLFNTLSSSQFRSVGTVNSSKHVPHAPNPRPFKIDGKVLNAFGFRIGMIRKFGETFIEIVRGRCSMLGDILLSMDKTYPYTGQPSDEVLWRTLIWDTDFSHRPATLVRLGDFQRTILEYLVHSLQVGHKEAESPATGEALVLETIGNMGHLDDIAAKYPSSIFPSVNLVKVSCAKLGIIEEQDVELDDEERQMLKQPLSIQSMPPGNLMAATCVYRRPILMDTGYLGMGLESCEIGDEVWIVEGCPTPLVLRANEQEQGFVLIGESYVHGVMQGEAVTEDVVWEKIQIL
ncbi:hypothetical protein FLONG3_2985 [Fusarium longipes]|uniref:Heterokaryon incompatibility domain-containing protein n=1 Tax=Fusarium longipes TaxID=694270 RepID=A0A395T2P4_9HYPO|nr:hypothetical protein FLONG3_2985 [Fusarium longipes]